LVKRVVMRLKQQAGYLAGFVLSVSL
jgi:hypothetical protein